MAVTFSTTGRPAQVSLFRQEHSTERPLPEDLAKAEAEDLVAQIGQPQRESRVVKIAGQTAAGGFLARSCSSASSGRGSAERIPRG